MSHHVVLTEPWFGGSHRTWAEGWRRHSRHRIELLTHEATAWRWRMRGSAVTLAGVPSVLYLHENQLTYPRRPDEPLDHGLAWANWRSMVAADSIWCNSEFHRDDLFGALPPFLAGPPDHRITGSPPS